MLRGKAEPVRLDHVALHARLIQGAFDQMRKLRGSLGETMKDPTLMHNQNAMRSFECR